MTPDDIARELSARCPLRLVPALHLAGACRHYLGPRYPGRVLCLRPGDDPGEGYLPTELQWGLWVALGLVEEAKDAE